MPGGRTESIELTESVLKAVRASSEGDRSREILQSALAEARTSEASLRQVVDTIPALVWCNLPDGPNDFSNQRWQVYTGISSDEGHGWGWQVIVHPDDLPGLMKTWMGMVSVGQAGEFEARLRRHDGEFRWFLCRIEPLRDQTGKLLRWFGTATDIADLKQAEAKVRQDAEELRRIVDFVPQAILILSPDGIAIYANHAALEYTGLSLEEIKADHFRDRVFHPDDIVRSERRSALSGDTPFENEQRVLGKDGKYRWFLIRYNPFLNENGKVVRWYATGTDIHDRKRAEDRNRNETVALREEIVRSSMFEEIVGSSEPLRKVLALVSKVAPTDSTVLIQGETGTGKELIARAIHNRSKRANRAFIRVNCAAIPSSLIASELFGHEKGSFTGALQRRLGRFESADGGTIFLDEIGELPSDTQIALLRVLQEREIERLGGNQPISIDVRVLAATNKDLSTAVADGSFRRDLFYRLNVFPLQMPALRHRVDDIPLLVEYMVERFSQKAGKRIRNISKETLELFQSYAWPGNIRELQNVVERAVILCDTETFCIDQSWLFPGPARPELTAVALTTDLTERERTVIENALRESEGRVSGPSGAAAKLGLPRQTLESKIRKLGIKRNLFRTS